MEVSVIICTHNSNARLVRCLEHLVNQKTERVVSWEVLICDYISNDGTVDTVQHFSELYPKIEFKFIQIKKAGKTPALLTGFSAARAEALCIIDDDNLVDDSYVETAYRVMSEHKDIGVIGAFGSPLFVDPNKKPSWFKDFEGVYAVGHQFSRRGYINGERYFFWGAGSVIRKSAILRSLDNGFTPLLNPSRGTSGDSFVPGSTAGEDPEMCFAILLAGYKLWYEPSLKYRHQIPSSRLTEKFIYDTTRNVHSVQPYLRLFMTYLIDNNDFRNRLKILVWKNWYLHFTYIIIFSIKKIFFSLFILKYRRIKIQFSIISSYNQLRGLIFIRNDYRKLKINFENLANRLYKS